MAIQDNFDDQTDSFEITRILESSNIAEELNVEILNAIGRDAVEGYEKDEGSRLDWLEMNEKWMELALQVSEKKSSPWNNASNVKYPLMTTAAVQFGSRAYPALVKGKQIVKAKVTGRDPDGLKAESASRISKHMSYQILEEMTEWEEDMDKLTIILPIAGCVFKKSFFCPIKKRNVSQLVSAKDLAINYYAPNVEEAIRKTHILEMTDNDIFERVASGIFLDVDLGTSVYDNPNKEVSDKVQGLQEPQDKSDNTPRIILEQHGFLDLDEDGYKEPYIITVDKTSRKVLRIVARFDADSLDLTENGDLIRIRPTEYFTKYSFIPNPDGGIYDVGFGLLLGSLNDTVNTLINQLIDAGTLATMQSGFISRGIRLKGGNKRFTPGEWKTVNTSGQDLRNGIFPMPVQEPSNVLFLLLGTILDSGEKLASVVDILVGENPGQNQPATTTLAVIEQGLKVFTAIHKRMYRAMTKEFKKLYRLNGLYLDQEAYFEVLDTPDSPAEVIYQTDYRQDGTDVQPSADPNIATEMQAIIKAQGLVEIATSTGRVNIDVAVRRLLEAMEQPNIDEAMELPEPGPNFDQQIALKELELRSRELDLKEIEVENEAAKDEADVVLTMAKAHQIATSEQIAEINAAVGAMKLVIDAEQKDRQAQDSQNQEG